MKKHLLIVFTALGVFLGLVYFNTQKSKQYLVGPFSSLQISLINPPRRGHVNSPIPLTWKVNTNASFKAKTSAIFYGNQSSPSALLKTDSPESASYPNFTTDYLRGDFFLPYIFVANLVFDKPQVVYYRAYAKVGKDHLWTTENKILIQ